MKPDTQELALIQGIVCQFEEMQPEKRSRVLAWTLEAANGHPQEYTRRFNSMLYPHLKASDTILRGNERQVQIREEINAPLPPVKWPSYKSVVLFFAKGTALVGVLYAVFSFFVGLASGLRAWAATNGAEVVGIGIGALAFGWVVSALPKIGGSGGGGEQEETTTQSQSVNVNVFVSQNGDVNINSERQ